MVIRYDLRPKKIKGILSKTLDGETVILKKENWGCFLLNHTASYMWRLANGKNSIGNLADSLSQRYSIKRALARKDAGKLFSYLKKRGLIDPVKEERQK